MEQKHRAEAGANQLNRAAERQINPTREAALKSAAGLYEAHKFEEAEKILDQIGYEAP